MNPGGAETFLMKLFRIADRTQLQMDFCVNVFEKSFFDDEILEKGGRIYHIPCKSDNIFKFRKQLRQIIEDEEYDNVLKITSNALGFYDLKVANKAGAKNCIARSSNSSDGESQIVSILNKLGQVLFMRYVNKMVAPSDLAAIYTFGRRNYHSGHVIMLMNGLKIDDYKFNTDKRKKVREEIGIRPNQPVIGHVGRFTKQKNHSFLVDVFNSIHKLNSDTVLVLVGDGETRTEIEEKCNRIGIDNAVKFLGIRTDIPEVLSALDLFVFPSFYEGMPNSVLEAQASGLKCIVSDRITREANVTGNVEYLSLNNTDEWCKRINCLLMNDVEHRTRGLIDMKNYDITHSLEIFESILI
jgi:glycosyltransferase involved in cell wall biosynthesis